MLRHNITIMKSTIDPKEFWTIINTNCGFNSTLKPTSRAYLVSIVIEVILKTMHTFSIKTMYTFSIKIYGYKKLHLTFLCKIESLYMDQPKPKKKIHYFSVFRVIPQNEDELISKAPY